MVITALIFNTDLNSLFDNVSDVNLQWLHIVILLRFGLEDELLNDPVKEKPVLGLGSVVNWKNTLVNEHHFNRN